MKKILKGGLALAALVGLSLPLPSFSLDIVTQEIVLDPYNSDFNVEPVSVLPGTPLQLTFLNFSNKDLTFSAPDLGVNVVIPHNQQKVVSINADTLSQVQGTHTVAYFIQDAGGNQLASSTIGADRQYVALEELITRQQVALNAMPATTGTSAVRQKPERSSPVRGFW